MERSASIASSSNRRKSLNEWLRRPPTKKSLIDPAKENIAKDENADNSTTQHPLFREEWNDEFLHATFHPNTLRAVCSLGSIFILFTTVAILSVGNDGFAGNSEWFYLTWTPFLFCGLTYFSIAVIFSFDTNEDLKITLIHYYEIFCSISIILLYLACIGTFLLLEIRMSEFGSNDPMNFPTRIVINFTTFLPTRYCLDAIPQQMFDAKTPLFSFVGTASCNNIILSGTSYSVYALLNILPMIYHMQQRSAVVVTSINTIILICSVLAVGSKSWVLFSTALFQFCAGIFASHFCGIHTNLAKKQFAIEKGTILANDQNSNLLYTLIPKNVVVKLGEHQGDSMLGTSIRHCTVMFCSLEPQEELKAEFSERVYSLLNDAFSAFDGAVKRSGMFKYQHVSDWYIVACPRAAKPFDETEQGQDYPDKYYLAMVVLADELKRIAKRLCLRDGCPCWLKVGLHCGPVAGAVIGCYRAFYCLYGDTINTSARMCKYAGMDKVHCSGDFAQQLARSKFSSILLESQGVQDIKGKGPMETFNVSIEEELDSFDHTLDVHCSTPDLTASAEGHITRSRAKSIFGRQASRVIALPQQKQKKSTEEIVPHIPSRDIFCLCSFRFYLRLFAYLFNLSGLGSGHQPGLDALSKDGRLWIDDAAHRVDHRRMVFRDVEFERKFSRANATKHRQALISALLLHLGSVACQWHLVVHPEFKFISQSSEDPDLAQSQTTGELILSVHSILALVYSLALFFVLWRYPVYTKWCGRHFVPVKIIHLAFSIAAFAFIKQEEGWTMVFCIDILFLHCWMGTLSFRNTVILTFVSFFAFTAALPAIRQFEILLWLKAVAYVIGSIWTSRISNYSQRIQWRMHLLFEDELERLKEKIFEFLPPTIAKRIMSSSAKTSRRRGGAIALEHQLQQACDSYTAVVLQLDICKFTVLSQTMTPMQVAEMVHEMYSVFDVAVQERGLFKMDTIGDAYVVAGFLPLDEEASVSRDQEIYRICLDVLHLARVMIITMGRYRRKKKRETHCRIGVATGKVFAGVLGRLQPRFHIFGDAVKTAEGMEQTGQVDAVHASHDFISSLSRAAPRSSPISALVPRASSATLGADDMPGMQAKEMNSDTDKKTYCLSTSSEKLSDLPQSLEVTSVVSNGVIVTPPKSFQNGHSNHSSVFMAMGWRLGSIDSQGQGHSNHAADVHHEKLAGWTLYPRKLTGEEDEDFAICRSEAEETMQSAVLDEPDKMQASTEACNVETPFFRAVNPSQS